VKYDIRKYYSTERIVNMWNSLPDAVVNSSKIDQFKNNQDRHWCKEEIMFDYEVELAGILSRSNTFYFARVIYKTAIDIINKKLFSK